LQKLLKKCVLYGLKFGVLIDKKAFYHLLNESKENTYYKILNRKSKKFYAENPHVFNYKTYQ
jgi:hypothetical protein